MFSSHSSQYRLALPSHMAQPREDDVVTSQLLEESLEGEAAAGAEEDEEETPGMWMLGVEDDVAGVGVDVDSIPGISSYCCAGGKGGEGEQGKG